MPDCRSGDMGPIPIRAAGSQPRSRFGTGAVIFCFCPARGLLCRSVKYGRDGPSAPAGKKRPRHAGGKSQKDPHKSRRGAADAGGLFAVSRAVILRDQYGDPRTDAEEDAQHRFHRPGAGPDRRKGHGTAVFSDHRGVRGGVQFPITGGSANSGTLRMIGPYVISMTLSRLFSLILVLRLPAFQPPQISKCRIPSHHIIHLNYPEEKCHDHSKTSLSTLHSSLFPPLPSLPGRVMIR